ncbi:MAG: BON domain-containing protein [Burkholderiales bacterium]|nr:BON domain-containing protein [Burkholderiales bacterium]
MAFLPIAGLALGAAGMYLFDPGQGRRRRALVRDQAASRARHLRRGADAALRDLRNRARGAGHGWRAMPAGDIPDRVLVERVRSKLGRCSSHPRAIRVSAHRGAIELSGPVLAQESEALLRIVRRVRGVREVGDRLERHESPEHVSALQGGSARTRTAARCRA